MKNIIKFSALVFFLVLFSCGNDEDIPDFNNEGFITIGDRTVNLVQGYLEDYGAVGDAYNIDFTARSQTLFSSKEEAVVYFELFSPSEGDLAGGNYEFGTYTEALPYTYTKWGEALLGKGVSPFNTGVTVANGISIKPLSGTFTVNKDDKIYEVSFTGVGDAYYYVNGALISSKENVSFTMEYQGHVKKNSADKQELMFSSKGIDLKEHPKKSHTIIF